MTAHGQPKELTDEQKDFEKRFTDATQKETESTFSKLLTYLTAFGFGKVKRDRDKFELFQTISNPQLSKALLDASSPQNIKIAKNSLVAAQREFDRQNLDSKTKTYRKDTASRSFFGKKATISSGTLTKAEQQIAVGERFHTLINIHEQNTRINQTTSLYGIGNKEEFTTNLSKWMKENPGKSFDDALHTIATQQITFEQTGKVDGQLTKEQSDKLRSSQQKLIGKELKEDARQKAVEYGKTIELDAGNVINKINSTEKGLDPNQLKTELSTIGKPVQGSIPSPTPAPTFSSPPSPDINIPSAPPPPPIYIAPQPTLGGLQPAVPFQPPISTPSVLPSSLPTKGLKGLLGKLGNLSSGIKSLGSNLLSKGLLTAAKFLPTGIGNLIGWGSEIAKRLPIIGKALDRAVNSAIGGFANTAGKFVLVFIGGIIVFIILFMTTLNDSATLHYLPTTDLMVSTPSQLTWNIFENNYLQITVKKEERNISWIEFENKYLTQSKFLLTDTQNSQPTTHN